MYRNLLPGPRQGPGPRVWRERDACPCPLWAKGPRLHHTKCPCVPVSHALLAGDSDDDGFVKRASPSSHLPPSPLHPLFARHHINPRHSICASLQSLGNYSWGGGEAKTEGRYKKSMERGGGVPSSDACLWPLQFSTVIWKEEKQVMFLDALKPDGRRARFRREREKGNENERVRERERKEKN